MSDDDSFSRNAMSRGDRVEELQSSATKPQSARLGTDLLKSATRCAEALLVFFVLLVVATLALNRALAENRRELTVRSEWYSEAGSMLGRARLIKSGGPELFEALTLAAFTGWPPRDGLRDTPFEDLAMDRDSAIERRVIDGSLFSYRPPFDEALFSEVQQSAARFGSSVAEVIAGSGSSDTKLRLLNQAASEHFRHSIATSFLSSAVIPRFVEFQDPAAWTKYETAAWVVYGEFPPIGGGFSRTGIGTSYVDRFDDTSTRRDGKYFLYAVVASTAPDIQAIEQELDATWRSAHATLTETPKSDPQFGVPGAGFSLRATDIVMLGGPGLVVVHLLFAMFWVRHWRQEAGQAETRGPLSNPYAFPAFGSPSNPLSGPRPSDAVESAERAIWLAFLTLPVLVLCFALLTRYDLHAFANDNYSFHGSWFLDTASLRSNDTVSLVLDVANMIALLVDLAVIGLITGTGHVARPATRIHKLARQALLIACLLWPFTVYLWAIKSQEAPVSSITGPDSINEWSYFISIIMVWVIGALGGIAFRRYFLLGISCLGTLVLFALLLAR